MMDAKRRAEIDDILDMVELNDTAIEVVRELLAALDEAEAEIERLRSELARGRWTGD